MESNLRQQHADPMFYQLSYIPTQPVQVSIQVHKLACAISRGPSVSICTDLISVMGIKFHAAFPEMVPLMLVC